jgi:hypothetical protein
LSSSAGSSRTTGSVCRSVNVCNRCRSWAGVGPFRSGSEAV